MSDQFDGFDEGDHFEIGDALRRLTGPTPNTDDAFSGFRRRVRVVRIQRTAAAIGGAAAVVALALGIPALVNRGSSSEVPVQSGGVSLPTDTGVDSSLADTSVPGGASGSPGSGTTPSGSSGTVGGASGSGGASASGGGSGGGHSDDDNPGDDHSDNPGSDDDTPVGSSGGGSSSTSSSSVPVGSSGAGATDLTKTCTSVAGSVTARRLNGVVTITAAIPAPGYVEQEREVEPEHVGVQFRSGEQEYKVIVTFGATSAFCTVET